MKLIDKVNKHREIAAKVADKRKTINRIDNEIEELLIEADNIWQSMKADKSEFPFIIESGEGYSIVSRDRANQSIVITSIKLIK